MWILVVMWMALFLWKCKFKNSLCETPFSKHNSIVLKGICAIEIMLGHLGIETNSIFLFPNRKAGILFVGIFFALSGYGLVYSIDNKSEYLKNFLLKRIPKVIIPAYMAVIVMYVIKSVLECDVSIFTGLFSTRGFFYMVNWYIWEQILLYVVFYICIKIGSIRKTHWLVLLFSIVFVVIAFILKVDNPWYGSTICFWFGIYFYLKQDNIARGVVCKNYLLSVVLSVAVIVVSILSFFILGEHSFIGNVIGRNIAALSFVLFVILLLYKFTVGNKVSLFLGKYSFEIFVFHGMVINIVRPYVDNNLIYGIMVIILTITIAFVYRNLANGVKRLVKREHDDNN